MDLSIVLDAGLEEKTNLPKKLRLDSLAVNVGTGFIDVSCKEDLYDLQGNVLVANHCPVRFTHHSQVQNGPNGVIEVIEPDAELLALADGIKALLTTYLQSKAGNEEE